jgi:tRNA nucleotidyltransferase (CCA-adding enzyme)
LLRVHSPRALRVAILASDDARTRANIERFLSEWSQIKPSIDGAFLKAHGLRPGPLYGRILNAVRDALLDGAIASREEEEAFVRRRLNDTENGGQTT